MGEPAGGGPGRVEVEWAPPYELLTSLQAYVSRGQHKALDLGARWATEVKKSLSPGLSARLAGFRSREADAVATLMAWQSPRREEVPAFLAWLGSLSLGDLYERLSPYVPEGEPLPGDLGAVRDTVVEVLDGWNEEYFGTVAEDVLTGLAAEAARRRAAIPGPASAVAFVEEVTGGVVLDPASLPDLVVLVPQYHFRPFNLYADFRGLTLIAYPAETRTPAEGEPPPDLLRLTRALGDESRLRILRHLAGGPRSFGDITSWSGLSKSTVHHHLVALRAAGLIQVHHARGGSCRYSLRPATLDRLRDVLGKFLLT